VVEVRTIEREVRPHTGGPVTLFKAEFVEEARVLCETGATDYELACHFEVTIQTLCRWKRIHPEFRKAIKLGKVDPDDRVERSLFERACGYTFESEEIHVIKLPGDGAGSEVVRISTLKHVPPDPSSAMYWLKNRRPEQWTDRRETPKNEPGRDAGRLLDGKYDGVSDDELARVYREAAAAAGALREEPPVPDAGAGDVPPRREALVR
jgi:hypothetical protein